MGSCLKKFKFFKLIKEDIWQSFADLKYDYAHEVSDRKKKIKKQSEYLEKMKKLKGEGKLSKRRLKELENKLEILDKMKFKNQKIEKDKEMRRQLRKELKMGEAIVAEGKVKKISKQIMMKSFYIIFKVVNFYPLTNALIWCIKNLNKNYYRLDPAMLNSILEELKGCFDFF